MANKKCSRKTIRHIALLLTIISFGGSSFGAPHCSGVFAPSEPRLPSQFETIHGRLSYLAMKIHFDLASIPVEITEPKDFAAYDLQARTLVVPERFLKGNRYSNHPQFTSAIYGHEVTHAMAEFYLSKHSYQWRELRRKFESHPKLLQEKLNDINLTLDKLADAEDGSEIVRLRERKSELMLELATLKSEMTTIQVINSIMLSYHEFLADAVPALLLSDNRVMTKALNPVSQAGDLQQSYRWRSFGGSFGAAERKRWLMSNEKFLEETQKYNPYDLLAPLRAWLGRTRSFNSNLSLGQIGLLFERTLDVVLANFEKTIPNDPNLMKFDPEKFNKDLYDELMPLFQ